MFHPIREFFTVRLGTLASLHHLRDVYADVPDGQAAIDSALSERQIIEQIHSELRNRLQGNAEGLAALQKQMEINPQGILQLDPAVNGGFTFDPAQHPFLAWLMSPQGIQFIWSIVSVILSIWHIPLPPLPPLPPGPGPVPPAPTPH